MKNCVLISLMLVAVFATAASAGTYYWDTDNSTPSNGLQGGSGTWATSGAPYWSSAIGGSDNLSNWLGGSQDAVFDSSLTGTSGTVSVGTNINIKSLTVNKPGYTFATGAGTYIRTAFGSATNGYYNGYFTINTTATFDVNLTQYANLDPNGVSYNTSHLVMAGSSSDVLTLKKANAYFGNTTINGGTLKLDGAATINASPLITIAPGAFLDVTTKTDMQFLVGTGSAYQKLQGNGTVTGKLLVTNKGTLAPGDNLTDSNLIGTLHANGAATLNASSKYYVDVADNLTSDCLSVTGNMTVLSGAMLNLSGTLKSSPTAWVDYYTILTYTGTLTGTFDNMTGLSLGTSGTIWEVNYDIPGQVRLLAVPAAKAATPTFIPTGGRLSSGQTVTINCASSNVDIRYTLDNTTPTLTTGFLYTGPFTVTPGDSATIIQAKAWSKDNSTRSSTVASTSYETPVTFYGNILHAPNAITVNGDLTEWADSVWTPLNQVYDNSTPGSTAAVNADIPEAYYAAKWSANNIYVAVKVRDTAHFFTDTYSTWNGRDAIEIYLHTTGTSSDFKYPNREPAQQLAVGIKSVDNATVWASLLPSTGLLPTDNFTCQTTGRESGEWLYYEVAMTPYQYMGGFVGAPSIISPLSAGQIVGFDVAVIGNNASTYAGMKAENLLTGKASNYWQFGSHQLKYSMSELTAMLAAMDSKSPNSPYSAALDLDNDAEITSTDLALLLTNLE